LDRHPELALHGDHDAALRGAVQLGQHHAGDLDHLGEDPRLLQAVLTGGGVQDQQHLGHRRLLLDDPLDLAELVHQAGLVLPPTIKTTPGFPSCRSTFSARSMPGSTSVMSSSRRMSLTDAVVLPSTFTRVRSRATRSCVGVTPTSAVSSVSSISSQVSSSMTS